jgi:hypothetical protein
MLRITSRSIVGGGGKVEVANQAKVAAKVGAVPHIEGQQEQ